MTDLLHDDDLKTERETAREPAKRWRNRMRFLEPAAYLCECGATHEPEPDEDHIGCGVWPSKDVAEQAAADFEAVCPWPVAYLGAFPVEGEGA